jgi:protein-L-isoaspartate(D-aspartate) O-methyltransferase
MNPDQARARMVERQLAARGISDPRILDAFRSVPREAFLPPELVEFTDRDAPLPIGDGQTISQPYIVAVTIQALDLKGHERVLEVGTGSGYAAALLSRLARQVFTIERLESLAALARQRLGRLGHGNVEVRTGDGTLGWPEHAPYDAIAVAAGGPEIPEALKQQLAIGGRLVIPVGEDEGSQTLVRVTREGVRDFRQEPLAAVRFVPLIGEQGWPEPGRVLRAPGRVDQSPAVARLIRETAEPIPEIGASAVDALVERMAGARVVLLGEATHGTGEFYRMRARITRELIERHGFNFVAVEADWPDAARVDDYVLGGRPRSKVEFTPFARFPTWMWRNEEVRTFVSWLRQHNLDERDSRARVGFHGLDLYSMFTSIAAVLAYLDDVDPTAARVARARYGTLTPWEKDPTAYGRAVLVGGYQSSEGAVVTMLRDMLARRLDYAEKDGERFFDAAQNARVVANAEAYYRAMYYGAVASWNLRDTHMFETLNALFSLYGPNARGIVWAHNSHVGDAAATEMSARGELNVGQLCRAKFRERAYIVGFGTDHPESYERLLHQSGVPAFALHLRDPRRRALRDELMAPRLERAIGVIYRPETERASHYFQAILPHQFDEVVWFDETQAVEPLAVGHAPTGDLPETYPFGL